MSVANASALLIAIGFLVPGFILSTVLGMSFPRRSRTAAELTLQYLALSCVNIGLWSWLIVIMIENDWLQKYTLVAAMVTFLVLFVSPLVIGLAAGRLGRRESVQRLLAAFGFMVHRFIPTAWDFKFGQQIPSWIIVRLSDGSSVFGFFGFDSFAGDDPGERDIYIEAVFEPHGEGAWQPVPDTGGILIKASEIATIEFRRIDIAEGAE